MLRKLRFGQKNGFIMKKTRFGILELRNRVTKPSFAN